MPDEKYTITITDKMSYLVFLGLNKLHQSKEFANLPQENTIKTITEQFRNLSNRKVPEVTEVHMINPDSIDVIKREKCL